ncbi:MAG: hypothetical protein A2135_05620 [Actinobacteria bacterium RBG_16_67_15]|jgi:hypothetical protein|nr:MAG: hypothetical protein A2135_05620 [Actinobacteria bacterium RBG_16_67_15]
MVSGILAVVAIAIAVMAMYLVSQERRRFAALPRDTNVLDQIRRLDEDLALIEAAVARIQPVLKSLTDRMPGAIRYAAVVTFDANDERTGHMSRAIALLNERRDGLVITLLHGPRQSLFFTKMIRDGKGIEPLSVEEETAVERALGGT